MMKIKHSRERSKVVSSDFSTDTRLYWYWWFT